MYLLHFKSVIFVHFLFLLSFCRILLLSPHRFADSVFIHSFADRWLVIRVVGADMFPVGVIYVLHDCACAQTRTHCLYRHESSMSRYVLCRPISGVRNSPIFNENKQIISNREVKEEYFGFSQ